jgi:hypothetical protein
MGMGNGNSSQRSQRRRIPRRVDEIGGVSAMFACMMNAQVGCGQRRWIEGLQRGGRPANQRYSRGCDQWAMSPASVAVSGWTQVNCRLLDHYEYDRARVIGKLVGRQMQEGTIASIAQPPLPTAPCL